MAVIQEYEESKLWATGEQLKTNSYSLSDFNKIHNVYLSLVSFSWLLKWNHV